MKFDEKQCKQCPFRETSASGWLGEYTAESAFSSIWKGTPFFCHTRIDYRDARWMEKAMKPRGGPLCAGGLVFANKIHASTSEHKAIREGRARVKLPTIAARIACMDPHVFFARHKDSPEAHAWREACGIDEALGEAMGAFVTKVASPAALGLAPGSCKGPSVDVGDLFQEEPDS